MGDYHLIYDDRCPLCLRAMNEVRKYDRLAVVRMVPLSTVRESAGLSAVPLPLDSELQQSIHLVEPNGQILRGAEAIGRLAVLFPRSRPLGLVLLMPGVRTISEWIYRWVARHRRGFFLAWLWAQEKDRTETLSKRRCGRHDC